MEEITEERVRALCALARRCRAGYGDRIYAFARRVGFSAYAVMHYERKEWPPLSDGRFVFYECAVRELWAELPAVLEKRRRWAGHT